MIRKARTTLPIHRQQRQVEYCEIRQVDRQLDMPTINRVEVVVPGRGHVPHHGQAHVKSAGIVLAAEREAPAR